MQKRKGRSRRSPSFGAVKNTEVPAARNINIENALCSAIAGRALVLIRYKDDYSERLFAPHAVYWSTRDKVNVIGTQVENPADPLDRLEPRIFEVGMIRLVQLTDSKFQPDPRFNRFDPRYQHGIICSV